MKDWTAAQKAIHAKCDALRKKAENLQREKHKAEQDMRDIQELCEHAHQFMEGGDEINWYVCSVCGKHLD